MSDSGSGEDPSPPPSPPATPGDGGALETLALDAPSADKARIAALEKENADLKEQLRLANQKIEALQTRLNKGKKPAGPAKSSGKPRNKALPGRKKKMEVKSRLFEDNRAAKIKAKKEALEKAEMAECTFGKKKGATKKASSATFNRLYGNAAEKDKRSKAKRLAAEKAELESTRSPIPKKGRAGGDAVFSRLYSSTPNKDKARKENTPSEKNTPSKKKAPRRGGEPLHERLFREAAEKKKKIEEIEKQKKLKAEEEAAEHSFKPDVGNAAAVSQRVGGESINDRLFREAEMKRLKKIRIEEERQKQIEEVSRKTVGTGEAAHERLFATKLKKEDMAAEQDPAVSPLRSARKPKPVASKPRTLSGGLAGGNSVPPPPPSP